MSGCALATAIPPSIDVVGVRLTGLGGLTEQQLAVTLCVTNPNRFTLAFRHVTADFDLSGMPLAAGASDLAVKLPPSSPTLVPFTIVTTVQNLEPQLLAIFRSGSIDYRVHGSVSLVGTLGVAVPYSRSGQLDLLASGLTLASASADPVPSRCSTS